MSTNFKFILNLFKRYVDNYELYLFL